ncbi:asparaginase [Pseudochrobactrum sp. MP213Fo]|uniref:asparaginase n=1 Tax=Pseudochrobactrum sp. MP213Fo TaxID=3022250 RepID=UPI003BA36ECD
MTNPVLVEVIRGREVESRHSGAMALFDGDGKSVLAIGDVTRRTYPRSAIKAIQALPFVESGAADAYGFGNEELAMSCASHAGEPEHVARASTMLAAAGLSCEDLECGAHWPSDQQVLIDLARSGQEPTALNNNCSGKHAGFLCTCAHMGLKTKGYVQAGSQIQTIVRQTMQDVTGAVHSTDDCGTDGCSIPTYAIGVDAMALGFARMATGTGMAPERAKAAKRLMDACMAAPFYVAGNRRACTSLMELAPGRIFVKTGAEGVFCGAVPELGLGFAMKCDDGTSRAAEIMVTQLLAQLFAKDAQLSAALTEKATRRMSNWNGIDFGYIAPSAHYVESLKSIVS